MCVCVCGEVGGVFSIVHEKAVDLFGEGGSLVWWEDNSLTTGIVTAVLLVLP